MPLFYFEILKDGQLFDDDENGEEFPNREAALDAATRLADAFAVDAPELAGFTVQVSDELGQIIGGVLIASPKRLLQ